MKKKAKRATSVQRIAREIYPEGTMTDAVAAIRLSRRIRRVVNAAVSKAVKTERARARQCVGDKYAYLRKTGYSERSDVIKCMFGLMNAIDNPNTPTQ